MEGLRFEEKNPIRARKTPRGRHLYYATRREYGRHGWGNTRRDALDKLAERMLMEDADRAANMKTASAKRNQARQAPRARHGGR